MSALLRGFRALAGPFRVRAIGNPIPELDGRGAAVALVQQENRNLRDLLATSKREGQSATHALDGLREEYELLRKRYAISQEPAGQTAVEALDKLRAEHELLQRRYAISQEAEKRQRIRNKPKRTSAKAKP